jgi:hypothetical protein
MLPVFRQHDHSVHEIVCYSSARSTDEFTELLKALVSHPAEMRHLLGGASFRS